jgi:uncharacterized membrane protein YraQ (UPF0718 family)
MDIFKPIQLFADFFAYDLLRITQGSFLGNAVNFFVYDTIKIFILLIVIIFIISLIRTFLPPEKTRAFLAKRGKLTANFLAAGLGIITPFCSCSAVPLFLGFVEAGVPLGVTFSFLVASPMINEIALIMLWGMFGWKVSLIYILSGMAIAIVSGIIIGLLRVENLLEPMNVKKANSLNAWQPNTFGERCSYARVYTVDIVRKIWLFVVIGVGLGAWIHGYVPQDFLVRYAGRDNLFAVPLVTSIGIPLYSNAAGVMPLVSALTQKGMAMGTALAFMMAVTALSLPEFLILRRVMKVRLLVIFASVVGTGIIFTGYLFNFIFR